MLFDRDFLASETTLLYHYCSSDAFMSIVQNHTIRFSDINMMNDAEEARWGYHVWIEAANRLLDPKKPFSPLPERPTKQFVEEVDKIWNSTGFRSIGLIASFSRDGDSLSQWRAYADDGRGFAIGFRSSALKQLPVQLLEVCYDREQQITEMTVAIAALFLVWLDGKRSYSAPSFVDGCRRLAVTSAAFKNPAWRDEQEVRCQHMIVSEVGESGWKLVDPGGNSGDVPVDGTQVQFQNRRGSIVAFIDLSFEKLKAAMAEIAMGPKCPNATGNVLFLLGNNGYGTLPIRRAGAAYR